MHWESHGWLLVPAALILIVTALLYVDYRPPAPYQPSVYQPSVWTDKQTGCQYFITRTGILVPRLNDQGVPMCNCT